jgi:hypothetical protein
MYLRADSANAVELLTVGLRIENKEGNSHTLSKFRGSQFAVTCELASRLPR